MDVAINAPLIGWQILYGRHRLLCQVLLRGDLLWPSHEPAASAIRRQISLLKASVMISNSSLAPDLWPLAEHQAWFTGWAYCVFFPLNENWSCLIAFSACEDLKQRKTLLGVKIFPYKWRKLWGHLFLKCLKSDVSLSTFLAHDRSPKITAVRAVTEPSEQKKRVTARWEKCITGGRGDPNWCVWDE